MPSFKFEAGEAGLQARQIPHDSSIPSFHHSTIPIPGDAGRTKEFPVRCREWRFCTKHPEYRFGYMWYSGVLVFWAGAGRNAVLVVGNGVSALKIQNTSWQILVFWAGASRLYKQSQLAGVDCAKYSIIPSFQLAGLFLLAVVGRSIMSAVRGG